MIQSIVFIIGLAWYATMSKEGTFTRIFMCGGCALLLWWTIP